MGVFTRAIRNVSRRKIRALLVIIGGDIVIAINGTRITGIDDLSAYLEEYTLPGQTIDLTIVKDNETIIVSLELANRPATTSTT